MAQKSFPNTEDIKAENERHKVVIQALSKELEDTKLNSKQTVDASKWLVEQNEILTKENRKLSIQLYHWRNNANDANDRLARINSNKTKNAAEIFYDSSVKRITDMLLEENSMLINKLSEELKNKKGADIIKQLDKTEKHVSSLKLQLEWKYKENRRLEQLLDEKVGLNSIHKELFRLQQKVSSLQKDNTELKSYLIQKHNVMEYLKTKFDTLTTDLTKRFITAYNDDKTNFFDQLKGVEDEIPEFLTRPLINDQGTSTEVIPMIDCMVGPDIEPVSLPTSQYLVDSQCDSGVGTLTDPFKISDFNAAKAEIFEMEKKYKILEVENNKLKLELSKRDSEIQNLKQFHNDLVDQVEKANKNNEELSNEIASWTTALTQANNEARQFKMEKDEMENKLKNCPTKHQDYENCKKENTRLKSIIQSQYDELRELNSKQAGHTASSSYAREQLDEYQRNKFVQLGRGPPPSEPHITNSPMAGPQWMNMPKEIVVSDGPEVDHNVKRGHGTGEKRNPQNCPTENSPVYKRNQSTPDLRQNVRSPTYMENLGISIRDNLYTCEHCNARMPSSLYWDHVRTCTNEQYNE